MQPMLLDVFDQHATGAVDDAFGPPGGARRGQHEQRLIERKPLPMELADPVARQQLGKGAHRQVIRQPQRRVVERDQQGELCQRGCHLRDACGDRRAGVMRQRTDVGDQQARCERCEPLDDRLSAHLGGGRGQARTDRGDRQRGDHRLSVIAQDRHHTIADADPVLTQRLGQTLDVLLEFGTREAHALAIGSAGGDGRSIRL